MTLPLVVWKSLRQHALFHNRDPRCRLRWRAGCSCPCGWSSSSRRATFTGVNAGFDAVLGARGSKLQLVLNAIFHLEASPGNLAWSDYEGHQKESECGTGYSAGGRGQTTWATGSLAHCRSYSRRWNTLQEGVIRLRRVGTSLIRAIARRWWAASWRKSCISSAGDKFHPFHGADLQRKGPTRRDLCGGRGAGTLQHSRRSGHLDFRWRGSRR